MLTQDEIAEGMKKDPDHWAYVYLKALELIEALRPNFIEIKNEHNKDNS